jgi:hypothetical protein
MAPAATVADPVRLRSPRYHFTSGIFQLKGICDRQPKYNLISHEKVFIIRSHHSGIIETMKTSKKRVCSTNTISLLFTSSKT